MKEKDATQTELFEDFEDILTVHQVRRALGVGRPAVYKLLGDGCIRCFKIGNAYKIPKSELIKYIQQSCKGGAGK